MEYDRIFFNESTNFNLSTNIYDILINDCFKFLYVKNDLANISGFLNKLIPQLSHYREDLHKEFLIYNKNDELLTQKIENSIYNVYFYTFDLNNDNIVNVPFRINKANVNEFINIHDNLLNKFNMSFTGYIRNLLTEYISRPYFIRELFCCYDDIKLLKTAIKNKSFVRFYLQDKILEFSPLLIEIKNGRNYICGTADDKKTCYILKISHVQRFHILNKTLLLDDYNSIYNCIFNLLSEEPDEINL